MFNLCFICLFVCNKMLSLWSRMITYRLCHLFVTGVYCSNEGSVRSRHKRDVREREDRDISLDSYLLSEVHLIYLKTWQTVTLSLFIKVTLMDMGIFSLGLLWNYAPFMPQSLSIYKLAKPKEMIDWSWLTKELHLFTFMGTKIIF